MTYSTASRTIDLAVTGGMMAYDWGIDGHGHGPARVTRCVAVNGSVLGYVR